MWEAVHAVREQAAKTFVRFTEWNLALLIADELEGNPQLDMIGLVAALRVHAAEHGPRVVCTALCNLRIDRSAIRVADDAVLVRAYADRHAEDTDEDVAADSDVRRWLGTRISRPLRQVDVGTGFDTTRTAALLTVEHGAPTLALARARARAQYAIAMWTVLAPPEGRHVLPDLGVWTPQPSVHAAQRHRPVPDPPVLAGGPSEEGGGFTTYSPFELPADEILRMPFDAMTFAHRRGAQAVLSASLQLLAAGRASRLQPSERIRALMAAVECLGEQPSGKGARQRFLRLAERHKTNAVPTRGWDAERVKLAFNRMVKARNIATHGADAVLLDLGYPHAAQRKLLYGQEALGVELAAASLQADLPILVHVVGRTLDLTVRDLSSDAWSDTAFTSYFT